MNVKQHHPIYFIIIFSLSCSSFQRPDVIIEPNHWTGKLFIFADLEDNYRRSDNFNKIWSKIHKNKSRPYYRFLDKIYFVVGTQEKFKQDFLVIEDLKGNQYKMTMNFDKEDQNLIPSYFLFDDIEIQAENMIGDTIWLNNVYNPNSFFTLADYEFRRFEPVVVLDVFPYQNINFDYPIWLKVSTHLGDKGFVRYNGSEGRVGIQDHYYESEPLPRIWGKEMITKVLDQQIELGMEDRQVRISIGNPDEVNTTSSRHGISEQWIYVGHDGNKTYYQFEYGKLTYVNE